MSFLPKKSGLLWRVVLRPLVYAVPFAIFFQILSGSSPANFGGYYIASLIFAVTILIFVQANRRWVAPRLTPKGKPKAGLPLILEIASYALSSILGSVVAALVLNATIAHGFLGSARDIALFLALTLVFSALFLGVIYAMNFQRRYIGQVRQEAEANAREEQEMLLAAEIQQALLPPRSRVSSTYAAVAATIPCRTIGGDFFDYFDLPGGGLGFILADVAGKGPSAAIMAANVQGIFASHVASNDGPAATLKRVNQALYRRTVETRFATVFYGVLDPEGVLTSCNAGHNPPFLLDSTGSVRRLSRGGLLIGPFEAASYEEETQRLVPGETLVLFSDGVTDAEAPSGEQFGEERLVPALSGAAASTPEEVLERVLEAVRAFAADRPPADDVTVVVVRYLGPG